jgi:hemolysin activation/secretion protein
MKQNVRLLHYGTEILCVLSFCFSASSYAAGPLRGNPVDNLPQPERPRGATAPAPLATPTPSAQAAVRERLRQHVTPRHFDVKGSHVIPFNDIVAILRPLAGHETTVAHLVQEVNKITSLYQQKGYPLSFALLQQQDFAKGLVRVTVVEGYVSKVRIEGDADNASQRLRSLGERLTSERPLTQTTLERTLNLMRQVPGVHVTPELNLPKRADGATELVLKVTHQKVAVAGNMADLGNGMQGMINVTANSLTPLGEQVRLTAALPTRSDAVTYAAGNVAIPIGNNGLSFNVDGYYYKARPEDENLESLGWDRKLINKRVGASVSYPFILSNTQSLKGSIGLYAADSQDTYTRDDNDARLEQDVDVRVAHIDLDYADHSAKQSRKIKLAVHKGIDGMGAGQNMTSNYGVSGSPGYDLDFTRYNLSGEQAFVLPYKFGIKFSADGQYSDDVLPSSEQVSYGGWRYGLGYPQGELGGDKGYGLSVELNRSIPTGWKYVQTVQPYVVADWARSWYNAPYLGSAENHKLSSVGVGVRATDNRFYLFDVNVAKPTGDEPINSDDRDWRVNANLSVFYNGM